MKPIRQTVILALFLLISGCKISSTGSNKAEYADLLIGPYSIMLPTDALRGVSIIGSENRGLALAIDRKNRDSQRTISISVFHQSQLGYEIDMRKFPRLVLRLEEPTPDLGLSNTAIDDIHNVWENFVRGRRTKIIKITGGHAYLAIDDKRRRTIAYLTADDYPHELNFISAYGISEKQLQDLILDNLYLNKLPPEK